MKAPCPNPLNFVVSSSFSDPRRVSFAKNCQLLLAEANCICLAPDLDSELLESDDAFVRLGEAQKAKTPGELERGFLEKISESDFLYVANEGGYVGRSMATEMGFALALGRPVLIAQPIEKISEEVDGDLRVLLNNHPFNPVDPMHISPISLKQEMLWEKQRNKMFSKDERKALKRAGSEMLCEYALGEIKRNASASRPLGQLSNYVAHKAHKRGFSDETLAQKAMLMAEEKGELAKALRRFDGVKIADDSTEPLPESEAPDLFFLLMDYCANRGVEWENSKLTLSQLQHRASENLGYKTVADLFAELEQKTKPLLVAEYGAATQTAALDYLDSLLGICVRAGIDLEKAFWQKEKLNEIRTWR